MKSLSLLLLFFFSFFLCLSANAQLGSKKYNSQIKRAKVLNDVSLISSSTFDYHSLDDILGGVSVVGIGEATHGTHEFQRTYLELLQFLVENHGFNTLFLEDEFSKCLALDRMVKDSSDEPVNLNMLSYWPWKTQEMLDLFNWIKTYNQSADDPISIVGVDIQNSQHICHVLNKYLIASNLDTLSFNKSGSIHNERALNRNRKQWSKKSNQEFYRSRLSKVDQSVRPIYAKLLSDLEFNRLMTKRKRKTIRDLAMGKNVLRHLEENSDAKGMLIAHNTHISKVDLGKKNEIRNRAYMGGVIEKKIGKRYLAIMQEFDAGCFMAYNHQGGVKKSISSYKLESVCIEPSIENSIGEMMRNSNHEMSFKLIKDLLESKPKDLYFHSISAVFEPAKSNKNQTSAYYNLTTVDWFDAMIFHKTTTPTRLLQ